MGVEADEEEGPAFKRETEDDRKQGYFYFAPVRHICYTYIARIVWLVVAIPPDKSQRLE